MDDVPTTSIETDGLFMVSVENYSKLSAKRILYKLRKGCRVHACSEVAFSKIFLTLSRVPWDTPASLASSLYLSNPLSKPKFSEF